ncbi:hypothetical protein M8C21_031005 [Ambrosia artemisiifolia]|uniref:TOM1-like protein 2 n=1 Tax=Ambrosia artemisiifolia TaxID=4212 RepID=A0AAD5D5V5_AMBAR|nr:hypothetical protein M8C21_031005 [Ambrosia artemisiifolia]
MMLPATAFSSASSPSSNSAVVRVDKATSDFLNGPDWTLNIDICDTVNANPWLAKDVVKALKKRLQHKNPHVQLLSLTLLETMVKNCGENVHIQIAERNLLPEMIKIVKKKTDMRVREKILVLLDSWQEAFGGRGGKYPQYYFAYDELRQSGVQFPQRSPDAAPIFTPPAVKDEVIVDVVDRCRSNQKKLMQMLASTSDEELLGQGIELNDHLQTVLANHDAIASGSPIPLQIANSVAPTPSDNNNPTPQPKSPIPAEDNEETMKSSFATVSPPVTPDSKTKPQEEEEEDDDFALLARRHTKAQTGVSPNGGATNESGSSNPDPSMSMALTVTDPPPPVNTTRADDMIDFLSLTLSSVTTTSPPSQPPPAAATSPTQNIDQSPPVSAAPQTYPYQTQQPSNSYVVPWAQSEPQPQPQPIGYIPPPWAATPGYYANNPYASSASYTYAPTYNSNIPAQQVNSYTNNLRAAGMSGDGRVGSNTAGGVGQSQPFVPSYRLFEDLNVLGNQKTSGTSSGSSTGQSMMGGKK